MKSIKKLLVANRGEIAIRIFRTCNGMGIKTVSVFSDADKNSYFVTVADEAISIGGNAAGESYLVQDKIIAAAKQSGADAIHPGYGFLSENPTFAKRCEDEGIIFIGPSSKVISKLGSKIGAKEIAVKANVPVVPGYNGKEQTPARLKYEAEEIGFPVLIKASAGGGGKGMRIVNKASELQDAVEAAKREAEKSFGDGSLLLEKYFPHAKHIEFQIFGDEHGNHFHLFDRECSMQRRYQKLIEESPSPSLTPELRQEMGNAAAAIAKAVNYTNAGTVEFLLDEEKNYYFLEVNTRLQVEHPVTEIVTGVDLVRLQIEIASGMEMKLEEEMISQQGHAIECRICAEDAENNFFPSIGEILCAKFPFEVFTRTDTGVYSGSKVDVHYDSMLAKLICFGETRADAIRHSLSALDKLAMLGITTNTNFLKELLNHPQFIDGSFDTKLIERDFLHYKNTPAENVLHEAVVAAMLYEWRWRNKKNLFSNSLNGWRNIFYSPQIFELEYAGENLNVEYRGTSENKFLISKIGNTKTEYTTKIHQDIYASSFPLYNSNQNMMHVLLNNKLLLFVVASNESDVFVHHPSFGDMKFKKIPRFTDPGSAILKGGYVAPMPGEIVKILVKPGEKIKSGKGLLVMSSMKMETTIEAHSDGEVEEIFVTEKNFVEAGAQLLKMRETITASR